MGGGGEDGVVVADQFILRILTDGAKLIVHVSDRALDVGHGHDGVLIEGELLISQFFESSLAGGEAFSQGIFSPLAFRTVARDFAESPELSRTVLHRSD